MLVAVAAASARCHRCNEVRAPAVACRSVGEHLFRFEIQEPLPHAPTADDAFEVADAAAAAVLLLRVQAHDDMSALPDAVCRGYRPNPTPLPSVHTRISVSRCPRRGRDARRKRVGVVQCEHRGDATQERRQRGVELVALGLRQVRRLLDDAVADDSGEPDADGLDGLAACGLEDLRADRLGNLVGGHALQRGHRRGVFGIDAYRSDELVVVHQPHGDVFHGQHADHTSHRGSRRRG